MFHYRIVTPASNPNFQGCADRDFNGGYRFYNNNGDFEGCADPNFNGGCRYYDNNGNYQGEGR
jgi:hypothetical protein